MPAEILFEDEHCLAFKDINPQAPVHVLLIPKKEITSIDDCDEGDKILLGHLMCLIGDIAKKLGLSDQGYRVVTNCKDFGGQSVNHLHFHILGGRKLNWPPG